MKKKQIFNLSPASGGGQGTEVEANPTLVGTESALTGLQVGDTKFKVPSGGEGNHAYYLKFSSDQNVLGGMVYYTDADDLDTLEKVNADMVAKGINSNSIKQPRLFVNQVFSVNNDGELVVATFRHFFPSGSSGFGIKKYERIISFDPTTGKFSIRNGSSNVTTSINTQYGAVYKIY